MADVFKINTDFLDEEQPIFLNAPIYKGKCSVYTVVKGDTISSIATAFGSSVKAIVDLNNVPNPNKIAIGQKLVVPGVKKK